MTELRRVLRAPRVPTAQDAPPLTYYSLFPFPKVAGLRDALQRGTIALDPNPNMKVRPYQWKVIDTTTALLNGPNKAKPEGCRHCCDNSKARNAYALPPSNLTPRLHGPVCRIFSSLRGRPRNPSARMVTKR